MRDRALQYGFLLTGIWANLLISGYAYLNYQDQVVFWQTLARLSGRVSLCLFTLLFIHETFKFYSPQYAFTHEIFTEKTIFTAFAFHHFIHLIFLTTFLISAKAEIIVYRLIGGGLAYLLILLFPILYHWEPSFIKKPLKQIYLYYVWFIMFMTYLARVQGTLPFAGGTMQEHSMFFSFVLLLLGFNLVFLCRYRVHRRIINKIM
jgi:hypothetical protein